MKFILLFMNFCELKVFLLCSRLSLNTFVKKISYEQMKYMSIGSDELAEHECHIITLENILRL
jgi:hypothetical protein